MMDSDHAPKEVGEGKSETKVASFRIPRELYVQLQTLKEHRSHPLIADQKVTGSSPVGRTIRNPLLAAHSRIWRSEQQCVSDTIRRAVDGLQRWVLGIWRGMTVSKQYHDEGHIVCDPQICSGAPTIRGTRITVHVIVGMMAGGQTEADVLAAYPELLPTDVAAALAYDQRRHP